MSLSQEWPKFAAKEDPISILVKLSRHYGSDPEMVLAGGGNTSCKKGGSLFIKGSGTTLADIGAEGFVELNRARLDAVLKTPAPKDVKAREEFFKNQIYASRVHPERGQRPSVESLLHNLIPSTYVLHFHPTPVNMISCCRKGLAIAKELLGDDFIWAPYVDPGYALAQMLHEKMTQYAKRTGRACPPYIVMQNHGLIVGGETPEELRRRMEAIFVKIGKRLKSAGAKTAFGAMKPAAPESKRALVNIVAPALRLLLAEDGAPRVVTFEDGEVALSLAAGAKGKSAALAGALSPDQIVYCKSLPLWITPKKGEAANDLTARLRAAIADYRAMKGFAPIVVIVEGVGIFCAGKDYKSASTARAVYLDAIKVMTGAARLGGFAPLAKRDAEFIENWEVESYRRAVAAGQGPLGRIVGKVAIVTGAAQGFGLEIAQDLAAQGAHVALLDINAAGAQDAAEALCCQYGAGRSIGLAVNVTAGASVADAIHQIVRAYGGFDLFVSNAGVLKAGSVKAQPEKDFDFVTAVNYKGYFVCVQNAAPILSAQHQADRSYRSDIIQINSKSGLQGSNKNGAYAGSKFGGIGLTQSFALELIEDGIKVNSICPGNFFDGPLWSDPKNGLFMQYLRTHKVPGAKTIEDVRKFYEAKVPMGRGCTTPDVMKAIYYLMEQQYETGQAVPVTGGQVMLS
ncbi:MAG: SDR family NAD(P)-dependent oxidoreductase [Candidatus Sumerlaeota bacterium]|nr:SDR family NAD(P)-dependent oxidoreductase [Candidatus Sumerlaeota bacterium]